MEFVSKVLGKEVGQRRGVNQSLHERSMCKIMAYCLSLVRGIQ